MPDPPTPREALLVPYRRPYRHAVPYAWRMQGVRPRVAAASAFAVATGVATALTDEVAYAVLGLVVLAFVLAAVGLWVGVATVYVRRLVRQWDRPSELRTVRERRPHAGDADPALLHDEFAVLVHDAGRLQLWRFRPLGFGRRARRGERLVPGIPQHSALLVDERTFDGSDVAVAAEQLADAQREAAEREAQAREAAHTRELDAAHAADLAVEHRSTAAALRHLTGQGD